ncbi:MAG: polymorphic toxin type 50 domain-containing protein [Chlamydiia bacterium]
MFFSVVRKTVLLCLAVFAQQGCALETERTPDRATDRIGRWGYDMWLWDETLTCFGRARQAGLHEFWNGNTGWPDDYARPARDYAGARRAFDAAFDLHARWFREYLESPQKQIDNWLLDHARAASRHDVDRVEFTQTSIERAREWLLKVEVRKETTWSILNEGWNLVSSVSLQYYQQDSKQKDPRAQYGRALLLLDRGNAYEAICALERLIESGLAEEIVQQDKKSAQDYYATLALAHSECGEFGEAVLCLDQAIRLDPENKRLYLDRAMAYFETGELEASLADYLSYGLHPSGALIDLPEVTEFGTGIARGIAQGGTEALQDFAPNLLSSAYGLSQGLWAFVTAPIDTSVEFCQAASTCVEVIRQSSGEELIEMVAPELAELASKWDSISSKEKGYLTGVIIGKYGVDIFAGAACVKGVRAYRDLKRANAALTLETLAQNRGGQRAALLAVQERHLAFRKSYIERLTLEPDKQGKHILGHQFYLEPLNRSIWTHPDPEGMIKQLSGTGRHVRGIYGSPDFVEIVECGEIIGLRVIAETGEQLPTTRAKIHYSRKGAHIVPADPAK